MAKGKKVTYKERMEKLKTSASERSRVFKELCAHLKKGLSIDCFRDLSKKMIEEYLISYPEEFVGAELEEALRGGKETWEDLGYRQAAGSCMGNSRSWYYNMSNRYGWREKQEIDNKHTGSVQVNVVSYASTKGSTDTPESE